MSTTATTTTTRDTALHAGNVLRLVPEVDVQLAHSHRAGTAAQSISGDADLDGYDEEQIRLMDEVCIVIDADDVPIGSASKKVCHLMTNIDKGLLHRAFSVFLFDPSGRLLLQQRAAEKITFPDMWTNTCCSHPLGVPSETGASLEAAVAGVKRAAQRKLKHELGIEPEQVPIDDFRFLTRIHYKAPSDVFIRAKVDLAVNPNEVQAVKYVTPAELKASFGDAALKFTPWFKLICDTLLFGWWAALDDTGPGGASPLAAGHEGDSTIRRML